MSKESTVKVSLDLNEELREYAVKRLAQFRPQGLTTGGTSTNN